MTLPARSPSAVEHAQLANAIRALSMDAVEAAKSGHPGMPMGMADVAAVLWGEVMKYDPATPHWPDRDRFVLSAGHGSMLLYALLHLTGFEDMTLQDLKNFRQLGSKTAGHPEYGHASGIETTTGPLGQGIANAVGMALAERLMQERFGKELVDHYTYVIAGDGCLMEGISHEAASFAGHMKLNKLIVLFDDNGISIDGPTSLSVSDDHCARFEAQGWNTMRINGHDPVAILQAIFQARTSDKPTLIACKTTIAYGAPTKAGTSASHGSPLGKDEIEGTRAALHWPHAPFEVPHEVLQAWRDLAARSKQDVNNWRQRLEKLVPEKKKEFERLAKGELPAEWQNAVRAAKKQWCEQPRTEATRVSSKASLEVLAPVLPELIGGSADLTGSNGTLAKGQAPVRPGENSGGSYIYYGVREHAMAAIMNGLALHGGFIPYGGTFLVFSDYNRPSIRLSALMGLRVIHVMTHDSIGVGEDGPTHQPVEHLASLRIIPNLHVFRPADAVETLECWELSIARTDGPAMLALSRQNLPAVRTAYTDENMCARGGYILRPASAAPKAVLMATGSEVMLAMEAAEALEAKGIPTQVVSMPCLELFNAQPADYRAKVLPEGTVRVAIEAGVRQSWDRYLGTNGKFIGMSSFGASGPGPEVYKHFGITTARIIEEVEGSL
jgi:transketolase